MSSPPSDCPPATIVELANFRRSASKSVSLPRTSSAELLSMRQNLEYQGSVEIDDLPWLQTQFSTQFRDRVVVDVRKLLSREFGHLRVNSFRELFVVKHRL